MKKNEVIAEAKLNEVKQIITKRPNGSIRIQHDYQYCPTLTEQHTAHLSDINYLVEKYKPDELVQYLSQKNAHRLEINNHDFTKEPSLQDSMNVIYRLRQNFEALPDEVRNHFRNHVEFVKFIDNPDNQEKMIRLGLMTKKEIAANTTPVTTTTQEAKEQKES